MVPELRPGAFTRLFTEINVAAQAKSKAALTALALAAERQAKINASTGAHKRGTPTPARPGTGPAVVSGTLRRSLTHTTPVLHGTTWECRVGTAVGFTPPYGRSPANRYGLALETGLRNGTAYPFLGPAVRFVRIHVAPQIYQAAYRTGWPRAV